MPRETHCMGVSVLGARLSLLATISSTEDHGEFGDIENDNPLSACGPRE